MSVVINRALQYTCEEYVRFPNDGRTHEVVDGDYIVSPVPDLTHQTVSRWIQFQLYEQIELAGYGVAVDLSRVLWLI